MYLLQVKKNELPASMALYHHYFSLKGVISHCRQMHSAC